MYILYTYIAVEGTDTDDVWNMLYAAIYVG